MDTWSRSTLKVGVSCNPKGDPLDGFSVGSGGAAVSRAGGANESKNEIVLLAGQTYIIEIDNVGGSTTNVIVKLKWYEEHGYGG